MKEKDLSCDSARKTAVALGSFDGVHIGHMKVIASALSMRETGLFPVVLVFDNHPQKYLGCAPAEIMQTEERDSLFRELGIEPVEIAFSEIREMSPEEFFTAVLTDKLNAGALCCGENYRFGKNAAGDVDTLKALCRANGVRLIVSGAVKDEQGVISSTRIRRAIEEGDIRLANSMLGRAFGYSLLVIHGDARGRLMGFPTINQILPGGFAVPAFGVYASYVIINGREYPGVTNIGTRPTFGGVEPRSETHVIGFSGDLYDKVIEVRLLDRIRGERKFDSMDALAEQIRSDLSASEAIFSEKGGLRYV